MIHATHDPNTGFDYAQAVAQAWEVTPFEFGAIAWVAVSVLVASLVVVTYLIVKRAKWYWPSIVGVLGIAVCLTGLSLNHSMQAQVIEGSVNVEVKEWVEARYGIPLTSAAVNDLAPHKARGHPRNTIIRQPRSYMAAILTGTGIKLYSATYENRYWNMGDELPFAPGITDAAS